MITPSFLFAPEKNNPGKDKCYYCGNSCDDSYTKKEYVKPTFTNRNIVHYPGSDYVCGPCVESLSSDVDIELLDGEKRERQRVRGYSWIITKGKRIAATKRHIKQLREIVLSPPKTPFIIILSDSGQKQLIFRAPIAMNREYYPLLLEDAVINVRPEELKTMVIIAEKACAAIGKILLKNPEQVGAYIQAEKLYGNVVPLEAWINIYKQPVATVAAWLCRPKEECKNDYGNLER